MNNSNNSIYNASTARSMSLKNKIFLLAFLLTFFVVTSLTWAELSRWKTLSRSYTNGKGITIVRTISPLIVDYINSNDIGKITKLVKSLTSQEVINNDIISVQISDSSKRKLAESAPNTQYRHSYYLYIPPTVVIENPLVDNENDKELYDMYLKLKEKFEV